MTKTIFHNAPSLITKVFGNNIQLLPSVDELFEIELAYLEFNCLSKEQLIDRSAFIKSIDNEYTRHYLLYSNYNEAINENRSAQTQTYFEAGQFSVRGGILDVFSFANEHPFRIERMLTQLLQAGALGRQKAIVFGQFTGIRLAPHDKGFKLASVVAWLRSQLKVPVLTGLPFGHVPTKVLLPVGAKVDLLVEGRDALVVWGHL